MELKEFNKNVEHLFNHGFVFHNDIGVRLDSITELGGKYKCTLAKSCSNGTLYFSNEGVTPFMAVHNALGKI